ncbi:MFS transporter [Nocardia sp. GCM10030253]|uniref:MFS transporter n=1 Tax=Nocardia sp. GCM10030253 TaxID=3273404 RepID=UPI0036308213
MTHVLDGIEPSTRATRREWWGLAVLALPCILYSMDFTVLHLAVPAMTAALRPSSTQLLWIIDSYGFLLAGALIAMGVLGDRIGRRRLLLIGSTIFGLVSVLAAVAPTAELLIAARALLGLAAATMAPSTLSLIRNMFLDPKQRRVAIGIWVASFSAGAALGPVIGGALLSVFWWGSVFLVAVPVMVVLLIVGPKLLPEYRDDHPGRIDLTSAALSSTAIVALVFGIKEFATAGPTGAAVLAALTGVVLAALFVRRQQTLSVPFIDLKLFRSAPFATMFVVYLLVFVVNFSAFFYISQDLQILLGLSPMQAGLWTLPWAVSFIAGSFAGPALAKRIRPTFVVASGLAVAGAGFVVVTLAAAHSSLGLFVLGSVVFPLGLAPGIALITDLIVGSAPPKRAGMASGLSEAGAELGGALGIALIGSAATFAYRRDLAPIADRLPNDAATAARDTIGSALTTAQHLAAPVGNELVTAATAAFAYASVLAFTLCALASLIGSLLAGFVGRTKPAAGTTESTDVPCVDGSDDPPSARVEP